MKLRVARKVDKVLTGPWLKWIRKHNYWTCLHQVERAPLRREMRQLQRPGRYREGTAIRALDRLEKVKR